MVFGSGIFFDEIRYHHVPFEVKVGFDSSQESLSFLQTFGWVSNVYDST